MKDLVENCKKILRVIEEEKERSPHTHSHRNGAKHYHRGKEPKKENYKDIYYPVL
jgi:hypothetical protein